MKKYPIYCGGSFVTTDQELPVIRPESGKPFAMTYLAGKKELETAISGAQAVQKELAAMSSYDRYRILMEISAALTKERLELAVLLAEESSKPLKYALGEIDRAAQTFLVAAEEAKRPPAEMMRLDWTPAGAKHEGFVKYFPVGLVAGIAPFNFPMNLAVHKLAPAIASGCPIILKPASATPLSTLALAKIIDATDLPKGAVSILPMDRATGNQLVTDDRFALLSFTGSPEVGWEMKKNAGKKKVVLELGGNAGVIISETGDVDRAVTKCLMGAFSYSGQICIHVQRITIHETLYDTFVEKFLAGVKTLKRDTPFASTCDIACMIDEKNAERMVTWFDEAVAAGATILAGGKRDGAFVEPTVLTNTTVDMKIHGEEAFGPSVVLAKHSTFEEALEYINDSKFGLQAGVFTNDQREIFAAWDTLEVGGVLINEIPTFRVDHAPYGGIKESGLGREGIRYAMMDMLEPRILIVDRNT